MEGGSEKLFALRSSTDVQPLPEFVPIDVRTLPRGILASSGFVVTPNSVESLARIVDHNGLQSLRVVQKKTAENGPQDFFIVDYLSNAEVGYSRVRYSDGVAMSLNIHTDTNAERRGLAVRRLLLANKYCLDTYHVPLSSGLSIPEGRKLWKHLIQKGFAEPTGKLIEGMYRFKMPGI